MSDVVDQAQACEEQDRARALAAHAARQARMAESMRPHDPSTTRLCLECDNEIEPGRLAALPMTSRCASCAREAEERLRRGVA